MVSDEYIDLREGTFHYRDWGGSGRPIVLLHGAGFTGHQWNLLAPSLMQSARIYALDLRGHGESANLDDGYDLDSAVADVREFIGLLASEAPILIGHSWGGSIALRYAAEEPETCAGIVLVDGGFFEISSFETWEEWEQALTGPPLDGLKVDALLTGARALPDYAGIWSPAVERILLANFHVLGDGTIRSRLRPEQRLKMGHASYDHKPSQLYDRVRCPVLIVPAIGEPRDERAARMIQYRRAAVAEAQERLADAEVVWMNECTHNVPLQRPKELAAAIERWLEGRCRTNSLSIATS